MRLLLAPALAAVVAAAPAAAATIKGTPRADRVSAAYNFSRDNIGCGAATDLVNADLSDAVARDCELVVRRLSRDVTSDYPAQHETQVEPDSFAWGKTVVAVFQSGRHAGGGAAAIGWSASKDAGVTWKGGFLGHVSERVSDPVVAYDSAHRQWLVALLGANGGVVDILVAPVARPRALVESGHRRLGPGERGGLRQGVARMRQLAAQPLPGALLPLLPRSGRWTDRDALERRRRPHLVGGSTTSLNVPTGSLVQGAFPVVRPDGTLVVLFSVMAAIGGRGLDWVAAARSRDGGATFEVPVRVGDIEESDPLGMRAPVLVSADVDGAGRVYVSWADCRYQADCTASDIVLATSPEGITWSAPAAVPTPDAVRTDHFVPGLAVEPGTRRVAVAFYSLPQPNGCALDDCPGVDASLVESRDGGATWGVPLRLNAQTMPLRWLADGGLGRMVGDYISTSYAGGRAIPVVSLAVEPADPETFRQAIFAVGYAPAARR